ncbi:MAG: chromosome segregation protein SMC [Lachnospiraceae bacterium]|nr:chromosome segregation protein SMC [Lachnospiraceae bacterium]
MYLKSIEVQGFKSFANKLKFEFHEGITGIVGPNGSGKSNVADAVRWVLGEQSAKSLRSGNMQDVIFAGTETRKPLSFASVSITFDNSDHKLAVEYPEVTVTRRLYRSGESEYKINNANVRLKDIHDIFYDTGIGKEGYSIIGQGQVERILNGKPEERRQLFDEAAGIVKFKKRKAETLKKLDEEQQNLVRVNDILSEITGELGPLEKQAATARIYLDEKEKLKQAEIGLFRLETDHTDSQLEEIRKRTEIAENDTEETKALFEKTRSEYEELEKSIEEIDSEIAACAAKASQNALDRQSAAGQMDLVRERIRSIEREEETNAARLAQIDEDIKSRKEESTEKTKELGEIRENLQQSHEDEKKAAQDLEKLEEEQKEVRKQIDAAKNRVIQNLSSRSKVRAQVQKYDTMLEQMGIRASEIQGRLVRIAENAERAEKTAAEAKATIEDLSTKKAAAEEKNEAVEKDLQVLRQDLSQIGREQEEVLTQYHRDASRLSSLRAMAERYEGYSLGIRKIMENQGREPGVRGVVADLLTVPEKYEQAIEIALGGSVRNIVTDDENTAKRLISYLKQNRLGRVTFLPLTSIRPRTFNVMEATREQGVIGIASDLVSCAPAYNDLKGYLLGRILIVDNVDTAIRLGRTYRHSIYMVTLEGESFAPGGSITGGSFKNNENLLGRKREIETLSTRVERLTKKQAALKEKGDRKRGKLTELTSRADALGRDIQSLTLKLTTASMAAKQAEEQLRLQKIERASIEKENQDMAGQMAEAREKKAEIEKSLAESEVSEKEIHEESNSLDEKDASLTKEHDELVKTLESIRMEGAALGQRETFSAETCERLEKEIADLISEKETLTESGTGRSEELKAKEEEIISLENVIKEKTAEDEENVKKSEELKARKKKMSETHRDFFEKRDELSDRLNKLDRELYRLNSQKDRLEEQREQKISYMWQEYEMTPSEIRAYALQEDHRDRNTLKKDIGSMKGKIRALGSVNVNAIEDYKNLKERHTFLTTQHDDLTKSTEELKSIITELDEGMRRQFKEKFAAIQSEFDHTFGELFGGGHGTLEIDTSVDILEADINIIAHPPGKKLQNMMQLSGGEKALTAIALLFAIQSLKPSPFCLLDEIEAALDDSNVTRFAEYLHKLTKNTQFIIITHRRGTMTAADRLYGITMQEKGVSTLVSVNLIEDKLSK